MFYNHGSSFSSVSSAVINNDLNKLSELVQKGERIDIEDNLGNTPLHIAAKNLSRGCISILVKHSDCPINVRNFEGCTSLYLACENKSVPLKLVKDLLDNGASPHIANHEQLSPLHLASKNGNVQLVKLLHKYDSDIIAQDLDNYTPLHFAVDSNQKEVVEYLCKIRADTSITDCYGLNPLMLAIVRKHEEIANILLSFTDNLNQRGNDHETAITLAIQAENLDMIKKLINRGASVESIGPKSPIGLLKLYEKENFEAFQRIWRKINPKFLSHNIDFVYLLTNELVATTHLPQLKIIFETPGLNLKICAKQIKPFFDNIFSFDEEPPNIEYFETNKDSLITVIQGILNQNALLSELDLEIFLDFIKFCPYRLELLNMLIQEAEFEINVNVIYFAFLSHCNLGFLLLQHCPYYYNSSMIFNKFIESDKLEFIKYIAQFFTPTDVILRATLHLVRHDYMSFVLKKFMGNVKSLAEIARDVTRNHIGQSINGPNLQNKKFIAVVQTLNCPNNVKDILLFKKPVNT